jgi:endonuclease/exonuclease/phosphatase family metal-dependent hydrolase
MVIVDEDKSDNTKDALPLERQYSNALTQHGATGPGEIRLSIFVKRSLQVTNVRTTTISCGRFNNLNSNKGAVATLFSIQGHDICILNCHLNAHRPQWERRNRDMTAILRQLATFSTNADADADADSEIDLMVCLGDLNYRVDLEIDQILHFVQTKDWPMLLNHDQLKLQQTEQRIWHDFQEAPIHFPPTFKCTKGSVLDYDVSQREPSYCDRILWRCSKHTSCLVHRYISFPQITTSDHKPVVAELELMLQPCQEPRMMISRWYQRILNHTALSSRIEGRWGIILMSCVTGGVAVGTAMLLSKYS